MKKILTIVISIALVAAIAIGGTLAYLTSNANNTTLTNTFVSGPGLSITLNEANVDPVTGLTATGATAGRGSANQYPIIPGNIMDKDPLITVVGGSQACYVFAYVTNTITIAGKPVVTNINIDPSVWSQVASNTSGKLYVYSSAANVPLIVNKSASVQDLAKVFTKITINSALTVADLAGSKTGDITVQAYAHQETTGSTYATALAAANAQFATT